MYRVLLFALCASYVEVPPVFQPTYAQGASRASLCFRRMSPMQRCLLLLIEACAQGASVCIRVVLPM